MGSGNGFRKWVQEKISFTDSSFTDAISQGNAQMYGPNMNVETKGQLRYVRSNF